ncbi:inactive hydroxysteroid dehydrogenase-like protein 1 isoform X3 [Phyllobates terribilis]
MSAYNFNFAKLGNIVQGTIVSLAKEVVQSYHNNLDILAIVGACYTVRKGLNLLRGCCSLIKHQVFPVLFSNTNTILKYGEWAVVTGGSDGIGKAYAEELASHGVNIILIGRSIQKLQNVSEAITATYGVKTRIIIADFNKGPEVFPSIKEALVDVDVGILVNNAGVFYDYPACLIEVPEEKSLEIINVNIVAAVMMVYTVLPGMLQRKRGAIINVSSITSWKPIPLMTVYAASKAFMDSFTRAVHYEYSSQGIFIQCLSPGFVVTKMTGFAGILRKKSLFVALAREYARGAVRTIGVSLRTTGYWSHSIKMFIAHRMPEYFWIFIWIYLNKKWRAEYLSREKHN